MSARGLSRNVQSPIYSADNDISGVAECADF